MAVAVGGSGRFLRRRPCRSTRRSPTASGAGRQESPRRRPVLAPAVLRACRDTVAPVRGGSRGRGVCQPERRGRRASRLGVCRAGHYSLNDTSLVSSGFLDFCQARSRAHPRDHARPRSAVRWARRQPRRARRAGAGGGAHQRVAHLDGPPERARPARLAPCHARDQGPVQARGELLPRKGRRHFEARAPLHAAGGACNPCDGCKSGACAVRGEAAAPLPPSPWPSPSLALLPLPWPCGRRGRPEALLPLPWSRKRTGPEQSGGVAAWSRG